MKTQHTPGPWTVDETDSPDFVIIGGDGLSVADVLEAEIGRRDLSSRYNAHLIAAAPELLEACEFAMEMIKTARRYFPKSIRNSDTFRMENVCATISRAIHKATGDQS